MSGWLATILIFLPLGGALFIWLLPVGRLAGSFALLFALAEIGFWINALGEMDFDAGSPNFEQQTTWFSDLNVSYHVGFFAFSFWLVGLAVVVMAAAIAYGFWVGRERPRAYFGLMLLLTSAVVGVFSSQDVLLFYVFFEAMLIPLYVLIGVWGGPGRLGATVKFVIYTMAGSLLMLAAVIVFGLSQGTFDLIDSGTSDSTWIFLGFAVAFAVKAPLFPFHGWLPDAYRESSPEVAAVLSGLISKAAVFGFIRICFGKFPGPFDDFRNVILALAVVALVYGSLLAFRAPDIRGVIAYSSLSQMGLITIGIFAENNAGLSGAVLQSVNHGLISATLFLLAGTIERRTLTGLFARLGGMARGRPVLATLLMTTGIFALAVPGSSAFAGEFLILAGVFSSGWGWAVAGATGIVLAAMYTLRLISAVLHQEPGPAVSESALDLRPAELGILVPLVACLLALSAWPASISGNTLELSAQTPPLSELVPAEKSLSEIRAQLEERLEAQAAELGAPPGLDATTVFWSIEDVKTPAFAPGYLRADSAEVTIIVGKEHRPSR
jgi:NADH-quinone oxidoreductase subunit M